MQLSATVRGFGVRSLPSPCRLAHPPLSSPRPTRQDGARPRQDGARLGRACVRRGRLCEGSSRRGRGRAGRRELPPGEPRERRGAWWGVRRCPDVGSLPPLGAVGRAVASSTIEGKARRALRLGRPPGIQREPMQSKMHAATSYTRVMISITWVCATGDGAPSISAFPPACLGSAWPT